MAKRFSTYWEDLDTFVIWETDKHDATKVEIHRSCLVPLANTLANAAGAPAVWPVRLTFWERVTGLYWGR